MDLPPGVTIQTLRNYAQVAERAIARGIDKIGTQALRLQADFRLVYPEHMKTALKARPRKACVKTHFP
jgi:hypothetical protein